MSTSIKEAFFDREADILPLLESAKEQDLIDLIEEARKRVCDKAKVIEQQQEEKKVKNKSYADSIKVLREEQSFVLGRLDSIEGALKAKSA